MGKIKVETEAIVALIKQTKAFINKENELLRELNSSYSKIESEWSDLQYRKFQVALSENAKCVRKASDLAEEQMQTLRIKLKQVQDYLGADGPQNSGVNSVNSGITFALNNYVKDLRLNSEVPDTLSDIHLDPSRFKIRPIEENSNLRAQFRSVKNQLIREWETVYGRSWPVYDHDIVDRYGEIVKRKGWKYDAHHIHPLSMGGENTATNITPFRYDLHSDHMGIHAYGSSYDVLDRILRENAYE